ncbi:TetR family transcriptional regulator [Apilactobacillus micheneri]|uniref:TetR family transcriptional regulator n=2 Tax=Apilactobacillus micheneri TaxID=1899430 RepID=A0ABY2Z2W9_9LACO|nr:TetR family transcriptional regulator [Apilactobacillus micheneri]TPR26404.1 TetR family transcriptional regulator [Apilactobacillus micheneri]TPR27158.1 TetR family transcriptional regulator [Apilactobacillus micheneri]TPR27405.1 TetR family transcriptional regulator [Apilactobacillus micheneri]TPR31921.1 TetR family transcriptional regulator [Apilactobacillus micheneri]TPR32325.1 TetR family transcriptional regulator [Apilactobacillus micheneri]
MKDATMNKILNALEKLLQHHNINNISVLSICKECGIVPQTFYNHFHDKYDLIAWSFKKDVLMSLKNFPKDYSVQSIKALLDSLKSRKSFYKKVYIDDDQHYVDNYTHRLNVQLAERIVRLYSWNHKMNINEQLIIQYHMYGIMRVFKLWLFGCMDITTDQLAKFQYKETPKFLIDALNEHVFNNSDFDDIF